MIRTKDELLDTLRQRFGESTDDDTLALFEDVSDTLADLENRSTDSTDWKKKYEENDNEWRKKYRDRFFNAENIPDDVVEEPPRGGVLKFEDLFK